MSFVYTPEPFATAPDRLIRHDQLTQDVNLVGHGYRFGGRPLQQGEAVLEGRFQVHQLRPGLILQRTRVRDLHDMETSLTLKPGLKIGLVVEGQSELSMGHLDFSLGPRRDQRGQLHNAGVLVSLAEPDQFRRRWRRGRLESKVSLTLLPEWLDQAGVDDDQALERVRSFQSQHLAQINWQPSARAQALAHQIVHAPAPGGLLEQLYLESRAVELIAEAIALIAKLPQAPSSDLRPREHRRLRELQALLDSGAADDWSLACIAQHAGMSASSLQRAFRAYSGHNLFDYLRGRRLDTAREALARDGLSVLQAAEIAGYGSAANFATAFKRRFGQTPSSLRARC